MCHFIIDVLLKIGKGPGALGTAKSILGVVEAQGRGGLHLHAVIMGIVAMLNASRFADDDDPAAQLLSFIFLSSVSIPTSI